MSRQTAFPDRSRNGPLSYAPSGADRFPDYEFQDYERDDVQYIGDDKTQPYFYSEPDDKVFAAKVNEDMKRLEPAPETERSVGAKEELGEVLEEVGEATGWESLSDWAREHLEGEDRSGEE